MIVGEPYQRDGQTLLRNLRHAERVPPGYVDTGLQALPGPANGKPIWDSTLRAVTGSYTPPNLLAAMARYMMDTTDAAARKVITDAVEKEGPRGR